ncbi:hypothetical protein SAMN05216480_101733 [Pustulibacterium marinum]|uniref:Uncharacterized protein n=1 Tax=Pustulibacterium marinum TaxID=1224947 RepID=A0A1I7F8B6_9FLAO|nr:hypothetical protein [Pustulibacterium marinum]SFU32404.1 hypothetical protein SAMN05216480_101733 [Pustulibacterium marinum]
MKKNYHKPILKHSYLLILLFYISCDSEAEKQYLVTNNSVGPISRETTIQNLESLFPEDSIAESAYEGELRYASTQHINIYSKNGEQLLDITPNQDSLHTIASIQILNEKYHTKKGISNKSTYGDLKKKYTITSIENAYNNVIISIKEIDAYFVIDKKHLHFTVQIDNNSKISEKDIPNDTPLKYFMISWNY